LSEYNYMYVLTIWSFRMHEPMKCVSRAKHTVTTARNEDFDLLEHTLLSQTWVATVYMYSMYM